MKVLYTEHYNFEVGLLDYLHPFDTKKFRKIHEHLSNHDDISFLTPKTPTCMNTIDEFLSSIMQKKVRDSLFIYRALEVPKIPFIGFSFLDKKILTPMRWGVAGTLLGAEQALSNGGIYWNLSGGYHHAMQQNMEGFCIYNDIGICHQQFLKNGLLEDTDRILIVDTDAHHGNGNAYTFMENPNITLLDIYNAAIYPTSEFSRERVNIPIRLKPGTEGPEYLKRLGQALNTLESDFKLAFVVAGTDVLTSDKLGGLSLSVNDIAEREKLTLTTLKSLNIPTVVLGGGGYSKDSAVAVSQAILQCADL